MDEVERGHLYLKNDNKYWNNLVNSFSNHFNGRFRSKKMAPKVC